MASNLARFFHSRYKTAERLHKEGNVDAAKEICLELLPKFMLPVSLRVLCLQRLSLTTRNYFDAKDYLEQVLPVLDGAPELLDLTDPEDVAFKTIADARRNTEQMIQDLENAWNAKWNLRGAPAPATREAIGEMRRAAKKEKRRRARRAEMKAARETRATSPDLGLRSSSTIRGDEEDVHKEGTEK